MTACLMFDEALLFANQHPVCWLATSDADQPHVRGMLLWFADATGFYFHTGSTKALAEQLAKNPRIEVAFSDPGTNRGDGSMMRVAGSAEILSDPSLVERLKRDRPWVFDNAAAVPGTSVVIFRVARGSATLWTMAVNCREKQVEPLKF
jgi:pyridoxamine 5'-phosphate oxidase